VAPELSIVIPVHDEVDNVGPLADEIRAALEGRLDYEMVFVDDASDDGTAQRLRELRRATPALRLLRHRRNRGQSAALHSGVRAARAPWVATLDGDGQNDPADIPRLFESARGAAAGGTPVLICGRRRERRDTWSKRVSSRLANGVRGALLRDRTPDTGCGLKLFQRDVYLLLPYFDHMHRFLPALMLRQGARVESLDVRDRPRRHGASHYGVGNRLWVGLVDLAGVLWLQRRGAPPLRLEEEEDG